MKLTKPFKCDPQTIVKLFLPLFLALTVISFFHCHENGCCSHDETRQCLLCNFIIVFSTIISFTAIKLFKSLTIKCAFIYNPFNFYSLIFKSLIKLRSPPLDALYSAV